MEDAQPNEARLARKGSTAIPRVRSTRPLHSRGHPYHHSRPFNRGHQATTTPGTQIRRTKQPHERELVEVFLPQECVKGARGCHKTRKRWVEDQTHYLSTNLHLSVLSFRYTDQSVLFNCSIQQTIQSAENHAGGTASYSAKAHPAIRRIGAATQATVLPSLVKSHISDNHGDLAWQSSEPGPSRIGPTSLAPTWSGSRHRPLDAQSSISFPGCESIYDESPTIMIRSRRLQTTHISPVPRRHTPSGIVPSIENVRSSTSSPASPNVQDRPGRWMTFRSGHLNVYFSLLNRPPSLEAGTDSRPRIDEPPTQIPSQRQRVFNDTKISTRPSTRASSMVPARRIGDCEMVGLSSRRSLCHDALEARGLNDSPDCLAVLGDKAEILPPPPDYRSFVGGFSDSLRRLFLPLGPHDKPRRVLRNHGFTYVVTAHGIIDRINGANMLKLDCNIRSPSSPFEEFVDDACMLSHQEEAVVILGHAREQDQISILNLSPGQVSRPITLRRDWSKRSGVSAIAPLMAPLKFVSGGYDHRTHLWDIAPDLSDVSGVELAIEHDSVIHSLLPILDTSHKLVSVGADRKVHIYDLSAERVMQTLNMSCVPYHAHGIDTPSCTLLEVSHLEAQFEVRDHRKPYQAVQRFGYAAEDRRGRYEKADTWSRFVVCGDKNGSVHVWDLRNISKEITTLQCLVDPVMQVVHTGPRLLACSKRNQFAYMDFQWT